jgi:hypothetical protein
MHDNLDNYKKCVLTFTAEMLAFSTERLQYWYMFERLYLGSILAISFKYNNHIKAKELCFT